MHYNSQQSEGNPYQRLLGLPFPFRMLSKRSFTVTRSFLAQMNSEASIASPTGITTTAGPGNTIMATPATRIVKPTTNMTKRLACPNVLNTKCLK